MIRACVLGLVLTILPAPSFAQTPAPGKVWRIGVLVPERAGVLEEIVAGLGEYQYVEGRNLILDVRRAAHRDQLLPLAVELVKSKPDVIVVASGTAALAAREATKTIPIVMASSGDAVRQGLSRVSRGQAVT